MEKVELSVEIEQNGEKNKELKLDFDKITGNDILSAEKACRALGDMAPALAFSIQFQTVVAAKAAGVNMEDLTNLPGNDLLNIVAAVNKYFFEKGSVMSMS